MIKTPLSTVIGGAFWTPGATILGSSSQTLTQLIKSLFANNEQGFAYDPNDLTTMFQDASGTVPVTAVGQPVGLIRDKSGRNNHAYQNTSSMRPVLRQVPILGPELIANGDFSNGTTGWTSSGCTFTVENGEAKIVAAGGGVAARIQKSFNAVVGKTYQLELVTRKVNGASPSVGAWLSPSGGSTTYSASTTKTLQRLVFTAPVSNVTVMVDMSSAVTAGEVAYVDDVSVKEITGYKPDSNYVDYDGVDDKLTTSFPAPLTNATIVRAVPGGGTQILTGQSIPATYEDNKDHCGLIVINRALTPSETSAIAAEFNKRAGV